MRRGDDHEAADSGTGLPRWLDAVLFAALLVAAGALAWLVGLLAGSWALGIGATDAASLFSFFFGPMILSNHHPDDLVRAATVARALDVAPSTVGAWFRQWLRSGAVPVQVVRSPVGDKLRLRVADVRALVKSSPAVAVEQSGSDIVSPSGNGFGGGESLGNGPAGPVGGGEGSGEAGAGDHLAGSQLVTDSQSND